MEGTMTADNKTQISTSQKIKKITIHSLFHKKRAAEPITMLTAYDYPTALALEQAGVDVILVGDSLGMVVLGYENTLAVTMEDMLHHCKAVRRGASSPLLVGDMPFLSYQASIPEAVRNAGRFLQEAGMDAVKLEGGKERQETIRAIVAAGIPVMGHLGLTPQSIHQLGGFRPQGRTVTAASSLLDDSLTLQNAGCFSIVLESIPGRLAEWISKRLDIPTIGIGAGPACDGQVLVTHDVLGLFDRFLPKFARRYRNQFNEMVTAFQEYSSDVLNRRFPSAEHTLEMTEEEWRVFTESNQ
jgi:3-methyl-2-oxobutanoate hydroxymethyltransferase